MASSNHSHKNTNQGAVWSSPALEHPSRHTMRLFRAQRFSMIDNEEDGAIAAAAVAEAAHADANPEQTLLGEPIGWSEFHTIMLNGASVISFEFHVMNQRNYLLIQPHRTISHHSHPLAAGADKRTRKDAKSTKSDTKGKSRGAFEPVGTPPAPRASTDSPSSDTLDDEIYSIIIELLFCRKVPEKHRFNLSRIFGLVCMYGQ